MSEQLSSRMSVELSLAGGEPVEVYDRAIGPEVSPEDFGPLNAWADDLRALMAWWDALPGVLRGYLLALAGDRTDEVSILTFADYLEENGRTAEGQRVRLLRPQPGDVLALWVGSLFAARRGAALAGVTLPPGVAAVALYEDERLEAVDPEQLRAAGWVRESEAYRRVAAEREECARVVEHEAAWAAPESVAEMIRNRGDSA